MLKKPHREIGIKPIFLRNFVKGWSLRSLAKAGNVSHNTLKSVLDKPYPKMERLVANAIGVAPEVIWAGRTAERIERNRRPTLTNKF